MRKLLNSTNKNQSISFKVKTVDTKNNTVEGIFSTQVEDRHGEVVVQSGWLLDNYKQNPVVLWAHKSDEPPIAKMLEIGVNPGTNQLEGKMQFAVDEYPFAQTVFNLIVGGYQKAFSAGFINNKYEIDQENDKVYLTENELLEMSVVPVPANQLSLAKSKGLDVSAYEKELGEEEEPEDEDLENIEDEEELSEEKAIEKISKSNIETIRGAITRLTELVKTHESDKAQAEVSAKKVEHPVITITGGQKKVSVKILNKAIRELIAFKHNL